MEGSVRWIGVCRDFTHWFEHQVEFNLLPFRASNSDHNPLTRWHSQRHQPKFLFATISDSGKVRMHELNGSGPVFGIGSHVETASVTSLPFLSSETWHHGPCSEFIW